MADGGMASMCFFITYMKQIVGSVAVIAIFVWVMGYFEKKAVLADIGQYVVLGCMIAAMAGWFVSQAGLVPPSCSA
ncbi:hypothetical protein BKK79_36680 (plasmid) [Cupriavidus sp. USMAA2-4]|nr:hypothetical protein BKK79_36680 [Cupriavidus sp. USMAA2-4]